MTMELTGIEQIQDLLDSFIPKKAFNLYVATVRGIAAEIAKEAKRRVPTNSRTLKKSIKVKKRRSAKNEAVFSVLFKGDGFYWRFVEHGTVTSDAHPFFFPAVLQIQSDMPNIIRRVFVKKIEGMVKRELKNRLRGR